MRDLSAQALRAAVSKAASEDGTFRDQLISEGARAVTTRFGEQSLRIRVHVEEPNELAILIPYRTEQLARAIERTAKEAAERTPTRSEFEAALVFRAWNDSGFLEGLRRDPRGAIDAALQKYKANIPAEATVRIYEEHADECLILVSPTPSDDSELSEVELQAAAGGVTSLTSSSMAGSLASKIVDIIFKPPTR